MKQMLITAGLACALALPAMAGAQTAGSAGSQPPTKPTAQAKTTPAGTEKLASADHAFVMEAAIGGMAEVEMGRLAAEKASEADVKQFGQRMVDDHGKANDELKSWAAKNSVTLPAELDAKHKATVAKLSKLTGAAFDKAYMQEMVADHNKDVAAFERASKTVKDTDLKAWATKTLPVLQDHQKSAKEIAAKVGGTAAPVKK